MRFPRFLPRAESGKSSSAAANVAMAFGGDPKGRPRARGVRARERALVAEGRDQLGHRGHGDAAGDGDAYDCADSDGGENLQTGSYVGINTAIEAELISGFINKWEMGHKCCDDRYRHPENTVAVACTAGSRT